MAGQSRHQAHPAAPASRTCPSCDARYHCGPFSDQEIFDSVPGWSGLANCRCCGSTIAVRCVLVPEEPAGGADPGPDAFPGVTIRASHSL